MYRRTSRRKRIPRRLWKGRRLDRIFLRKELGVTYLGPPSVIPAESQSRNVSCEHCLKAMKVPGPVEWSKRSIGRELVLGLSCASQSSAKLSMLLKMTLWESMQLSSSVGQCYANNSRMCFSIAWDWRSGMVLQSKMVKRPCNRTPRVTEFLEFNSLFLLDMNSLALRSSLSA